MSATKIPCARCGIPKAHTNWDDVCHQCVALEQQQKDTARIRELLEKLQ